MIAATLEIQMLTDIARLQKDMDVVKSTVRSTMTDVEKAIAGVKSAFLGLASGLSVTAFVSMIKSAVELEANYVRLSEVAGTTASKFSAFDLPARLAGSSLESVAASVAKLSRSIGEARLGDVNKGGMLKALGIDVSDGRDAADIFVDVGKALSGMKDQTIASAAAMSIFGRGFAEMRPVFREILEQGELIPRATDEQAAAAKRLEDQLVLSKFAFDENVRAVAEGLVPSLLDLGKAFRGSKADAEQLTDLGDTLGTMLKGVGSIAFAAADIFYGLGHQIAGLAAAAGLAAQREFTAAFQMISDVNAEVEAHTKATNMRIGALWSERVAMVKKRVGEDAARDEEGSSSGGKQAAVQKLMDDKKHAEERVKQLQASASLYAGAIKLASALADEAFKQGGIDNLRTQIDLINQRATLNQIDLQAQKASLEERVKIYAGQGELAKAAETQGKLAEVNAKIVADQILTNAQIESLKTVTAKKQQDEFNAFVDQHIAAGATLFESQRGVEIRTYDQRIQDLDLFIQATGASEEQGNERKRIMADEHARSMSEIAKQEWQNRVLFANFTNRDLISVNENLFGVLAGLMNSGSRRMFQIGKIASIANATIKTYEAANNAFATGTAISVFAGYAFMAAAILAGIANVQKINATQFGGGAGASGSSSFAPGVGGSVTPVVPVQSSGPSQPAGPQIQIFINGNIIGQEDYVRDQILPVLVDGVATKDWRLVAPQSRNAQDIREGAP